MSKVSLKASSTRMRLYRKKKLLEEEVKLKPFGFCCSMDAFDPLTKYDQQIPLRISSLTSVHECPASKLQVEYFTPRHVQEKKRFTKIKMPIGDQSLKKGKLNYFQSGRNDGSIKWYLEDEITLARDIFWMDKQKIYNEMSDKAIKTTKEKEQKHRASHKMIKYPRWYQDFSPKQMKNLLSLEDIMHIDYEKKITIGTQMILIAIGIISTFFKIEPSVIKQLQTLCKLNSVCFLQEIYKILTGSDFQEEEYKKFYDCNERIILSAIAFLTLPETIMELHRRLPQIIMPKLPPKPRPSVYLRRKSSCPYKEELFRCFDWATYRNDLQRWWKKYNLIPVPKVMLSFKEYRKPFIDNDIPAFNKREEKDICSKYLQKTDMKKLQKIIDQQDPQKVDQRTRHEYEDAAIDASLCTKKLEVLDVQRSFDENKKFDFMITGLGEKSASVEYKICGMLKPPGAGKKSWLGGKEPHYIIAGASEDPPNCSVTYEITGVADVTPSNSDERFFAVLKLGDGPRKIFPSGREHLSRKWQDWLFNADEEFRRLQRQTNELIKSVRATTRLVFPEAVCDSCCSCRQTVKTREKQRQTKTPYLLIDNVMNNKDKKYIVGSMVMHSPAPSPTGSEVNLLEMVASQDEIKTNIIINSVTKENGKTQYYISGVHKEKVHVPSRIADSPALQTASPQPRNVPPCACAIRQMFDKEVSSSVSKDDILWTKDEGLCMGKKYRPDELGAYSCKMYPGDKSCRRNPFTKLIKIQEQEEMEGEKEKTESTEMKEPTRVLEKKGRFIPDPDYPAYDNPWNIKRIAPSAKEDVTDYEKNLKLTPASLPAVSSPVKIQKKQKDISSSNKVSNKDVSDQNPDQETSPKVSAKSPKILAKKAQRKKNGEKEYVRNINKQNNNIQVSKKITADARGARSPNKLFKTMDKTRKQSISILADINQTLEQQFDKVSKMRKRISVKRGGRKIITDRNDEINGRKQEMEKLKTMMKTYTGALGDVQPAILPWEQPPSAEPEERLDDTTLICEAGEEESHKISKDPCGWRTKSEQELPTKKNLVYLCEPNYPLETVAVRPGGRPCRCRENRNKKKVLMYNVSGLVDEKKDRRRIRKPHGRTKLENENRIIDGVTYFTPPVSPRRSDEYVPEYDLLKSPYDTCVGEVTYESSKLLEKRPKAEKILKKFDEPCGCINRTGKTGIAKEDVNQKEDIEEARQKLMELRSPEERLEIALKDSALMEHFTQPEYDASCRTSYKRNKRDARPLRLKMVKPVCECKYERKIVERNEERTKWKARQQKLKALKKQPFTHIVDTSRPMVPDTKFIISDVKRIPLEDEYADEVKYCITGVAEDLTMSPPQRIIDSLTMHTPVVTPEPSKEDFRRDAPHRHWSPMNIPLGPLPRKDAALKEEMERRKRVRDEAFKMIYGEEQDSLKRRDCPETCILKKSINVVENGSQPEMVNASTEKEISEVLVESYLSNIKRPEKTISKDDQQQDASYKPTIERIDEENDDDETHLVGDGNRRHLTDKLDLVTIVKTELKKMAAEGYVFAKLPKCYLMPQLQDWLMYRKGIAFSKTDKNNLMLQTINIWKEMDLMPQGRINSPSIHMTKHQLRKLTYDRAEEIREKIKKEIAIFHSKVRKTRVFYARSSWGTMEFGKFPSAWFKNAFFTYMASKEADGYVYKLDEL